MSKLETTGLHYTRVIHKRLTQVSVMVVSDVDDDATGHHVSRVLLCSVYYSLSIQ